MSELNKDQQRRALEVMQEYLNAKDSNGKPVRKIEEELDKKRRDIIETELGPLVSDYLGNTVPLTEFKTRIDSLNRRHEYWGFMGIKGQMFFNMILNVTEDEAETDQELKAALSLPANDEIAKSRIKTFVSYIRRIGDAFVESSGKKHGRPKISSIPFFLTYFWQIQAPETWPVFYTNSVNTMIDLNFWQPSEDLAADYIAYKHIHEVLATIFTHNSDQQFGFYEVEHVFWIKGGNPRRGMKPARTPGSPDGTEPVVTAKPTPNFGGQLERLPDSFVPPVVSIISRLAINDPTLTEAAAASGTSIPRAFEKSIDAAFTIIGYESKLLGQGKGRCPDGISQDIDNSYAIIWDAKVRAVGYSMGTDDRAIREYIDTQSRDLKRKRSLRNIYYAIISSGFQDDHDETIRELKMETDIAEVCLLTADALVAMVEVKLRDPLGLSLGSDGLQRLFSTSGVISSETVRGMLG